MSTGLGCFLVLILGLNLVGFSKGIEQHESYLWDNIWKNKEIDCTKTRWIHSAKTSSMFCLAIQHACCPSAFEKLTEGISMSMLQHVFPDPHHTPPDTPFSYESQYCYRFHRKGYKDLQCTFAGQVEHAPLLESIDMKEHMGMIFVREPKSRVISAFLDGYNFEGYFNRTMGHSMRDEFQKMDMQPNVTRKENMLRKFEIFANKPTFKGYQTKLLLNKIEIDLSVYNETLVDSLVMEAKKKLRQFFFVGDFAQYARSVQVFHSLAHPGKYKEDLALVSTTTTFTDVIIIVSAATTDCNHYAAILYRLNTFRSGTLSPPRDGQC
jgi:hypothetical protein